MRVPHHSERESENRRTVSRESPGVDEKLIQKSRFNTSLERKIEQLSCKSETLGWSFIEFSAHILEVLTVLQHRKKVKRLTASKQRVSRTI
jgi:hypothetical protein